MTGLPEIAAAIALVIGGAFTLIGSFGLLKLDQSMKRLHAPTKAGTLGIGALLLAGMILNVTQGDGSLAEILIMAFLFVTAPVSAHFIAKVFVHTGTCETPPPPPRDDTWSTLAQTPVTDEARLPSVTDAPKQG